MMSKYPTKTQQMVNSALHSKLCVGATVRIQAAPDQDMWTKEHIGEMAVIINRVSKTNMYLVVTGDYVTRFHILDFELVCMPCI